MPLAAWAIEPELDTLDDWLGPAAPEKLIFPALIGQSLSARTNVKQLRFVIGESSRTLTLPLDEPILIGRADPERGVYPALDLSCDNAGECGVSRRHALIEVTDADIVLTDLGSTNGTLLNTFPIPPDLPYSLRNGDRIHIGSLLIQVYFQ
jgi:pSer/pThr/pTyr-binding forkhead associated (FHA) protein